MATSCYGMSAISCGSPVARRAGVNQLLGASNCNVLALKRPDVRFRVRSMAEQEGESKLEQTETSAVPPPRPTPTPKPKVSTNLFDVMAFSGPGPERINGRLAMIGFVTAMGVELANGQDIFSQLQNGGFPWFLATTALLSAASLIPMIKGVTAESKSDGLMTSDAEIWNGRFAMLGLVALAFTEYVTGSALV